MAATVPTFVTQTTTTKIVCCWLKRIKFYFTKNPDIIHWVSVSTGPLHIIQNNKWIHIYFIIIITAAPATVVFRNWVEKLQ